MVISWSFLKAFEQCPYQQKLIRIDKVRPEKPDERRFIKGTVGHKFFQIWAKRGFDDKIDPMAAGRLFDGLIRRKYIKWRDESDCGKLRERVIKEASLLIETVRHHGIDKIRDAQVESFLLKALPDGQNYVGGIVDLIGNNGSWIIELKMSADTKWADPDQLIFYGLLLAAIQRRYPDRLSFFLPLMPNVEDTLLDINFLRSDLFDMYQQIQDIIFKSHLKQLPATGNPETCRYCIVRNYCNQL